MTPKQIIAKELGLKPSQIRVTHGRGTARHWLRVSTPALVAHEKRDAIEKILVEKSLCGQYLTDFGQNDDYEACVNWHVI